MDKPNAKVTDALRHDLEASWHRFLDLYEPLRPELYRYCRHLSRNPWDADDLVQDALFRAFAKLGCMNDTPANPRAWFFRIASNLWIDRIRAREPEPESDPERASGREPRAVREAAGTLLSRLSPQERAAVVLKEAFNFTLEEIAETLSTTPGTVKSALQNPRVEPRLHRGEWLLVHWYAHSDGEAVRALTRVEADGDELTRVRNYFFTPDVLAEICAELQVPFRSNGYRHWTPAREEA
jgi:RNA polymerase sigma-70 factor (ECF subfamily)